MQTRRSGHRPQVLYDDGAREFLKFAEERWKLLESEDESESEGEDDRDAQESEGREEEVEGADESENGEDSAGEGERAETEEGAGFEPEGGENSGRREETGGGKAANRGQENGQNGCAETSEAPRKWRRKSVSPAARKARARRSGGAETGAGPGGGNTKTGNGVEGGVGAEHEDPPAEHGQEIVSEVLRMVSDMERAEGASEELNEGLEGWSAERGGGVNGTDAGGAEVGTGGSGREGGAGADGAARAEAGLHIVAYKESPFASLVSDGVCFMVVGFFERI